MGFKKRLSHFSMFLQVLKYKFLSDCENVTGKARYISPVLLTGKGKIVFDENVNFGVRSSAEYYNSYIYIDSRKSTSIIHFGKNFICNNNVRIISDGAGVYIGDDCLMGSNVEIIDSNFHDLNPLSRRSGKTILKAPVTIQNNVFIGNNVTILKGVTIGNNSVVGNSSVVTKNIPENVVAAGNPAKIITKI
jgi:galactoside O-acetyltransferase